jgi:hypothetical protein
VVPVPVGAGNVGAPTTRNRSRSRSTRSTASVLQPIVNQQVGQALAALEKRVEEKTGGELPGGAAQGTHPAAPEAYEPEPEGPTRSTEG